MNQKSTKYWVILLLTLLLTIQPASAQRTMSGQFSLAVSAHYNGSFLGAEAFLSQYTLIGFWEAGVGGDAFTAPLSNGLRLEYADVAARGGYLFRLVGTRNRALNLYAGGGALVGIEAIDPRMRIPSYYDLGLPSIGFLYGLYAKSQAEVFIGRKVALTLGGGLSVNFSSRISHLHPDAELGIKILL